jgi:hypothetical protein
MNAHHSHREDHLAEIVARNGSNACDAPKCCMFQPDPVGAAFGIGGVIVEFDRAALG